MLLEFSWISLRAGHFLALMLSAGMAASTQLAPAELRQRLGRALSRTGRGLLWINAITVTLLFGAQCGMMGNGWIDVINPALWKIVSGTRFGFLGLLQIILAWLTLFLACRSPLGCKALALGAFQLVLIAGTGHSAMNSGLAGAGQQLAQSLHLLAAAGWSGGLVIFLYCLRLVRDAQWREQSIQTMMRCSRYGHLAVVLVVAGGMFNGWLILGWPLPWSSHYLWLLGIKIALVIFMVALAIYNRYRFCLLYTSRAHETHE